MIKRYRSVEMEIIWSEESRYRRWFEVEVAALQASVALGVIPPTEIPEWRIPIDVSRIHAIELEVRHDFVAFLRYLEEQRVTRFIHFGLTSSDVVDTAFGMTIFESLRVILNELSVLLYELNKGAKEHQDTRMIGRTHGVAGEPITLGLKILNWMTQIERCTDKLAGNRDEVSVGMFSGSMGTYAHLKPEVEKLACKSLGLLPDPVTNQVIQRDRHASVLCNLAILAGSLERIAVDVRLMQSRGEIFEPFSRKQRGSSSMPTKRNPVASENICGLARLVRSYASAGLENIGLWGERDITHSSVERVIFPDAFALVQSMITGVQRIVSGLRVGPHLIPEGEFDDRQEVVLNLIREGHSRSGAEALEPQMPPLTDGPDPLRFVDVIFKRLAGGQDED